MFCNSDCFESSVSEHVTLYHFNISTYLTAPVPMEMDESILKAHFSECNDVQCVGSGNCKHSHCKWCGKVTKTLFLSRRHFQQSHVSHAVLYNAPCYPCKQHHGSQGKSNRAHYHSPICSKTVLNKKPFQNHLESHVKRGDYQKKESANGNVIIWKKRKWNLR